MLLIPQMKKQLMAGILVVWAGFSLVLAASPSGTPKPTPSPSVESFAGKVVETMNVANYTYALIDIGPKRVWTAAPQFPVKVGDSVTVTEARPMADYHSKTLNRTFDVVYFSGSVAVNGVRPSPVGAAELPKDHPPIPRPTETAAPDLSGIKRAASGQTVAEVYSGREKLAGKPITVRGRVVKYSPMIMGKNWLHIRDGSGAEGSNDLTVTTATPAKVGDLILVTGVLKRDRDFGAGYKYGLIVEDAAIVVE